MVSKSILDALKNVAYHIIHASSSTQHCWKWKGVRWRKFKSHIG